MYVSTKDWRAFVSKLSRINTTAADAVKKWVAQNGFANTNALIAYAYEVADYYGTASASLAALMYNSISELEQTMYPPAELAPNPSYEDIAEAVNGTLKTSQNANTIGSAVGRLVKRTGQDTLLNNAVRDGAQWAWIPSGDTCAFCITLASRGWQRASASALKGGHAEHIHANCDCTYMIRHSDSLNVRGYDPGAYKRMYYDAPGGSSRSKINAMRRKMYQENKDVINAQKREAYAMRTQPKAETDRQKLEAQAREVYISRGGHDNLTASEASTRFDKLIDAQTDAQLRKYIQKHKQN